MLGADGSAQSAPMSVEALREQLRSKVEAKRAEQEWLRQQGRAKQVGGRGGVGCRCCGLKGCRDGAGHKFKSLPMQQVLEGAAVAAS